MAIRTDRASLRLQEQTAAVLPDKSTTPRLDVDVLPRPRLWDRLEESLRSPVVLICAPAGFGKTVLCSSWLAKRPPRGRVAWVTLDRDDGEPGRFWRYVEGALFGARARPMRPEATAASRRAFLTQRVADLGDGSGAVTVVLDDVHQLAGSRALEDLHFLLRHVPQTCRVILLSRHEPDVQLARLRLAGDVATITAADLACTPMEASHYLQMHGLSADEADLARLMEHTEGWIAGLRLLVLSARGATTGHNLLRQGPGQSELVTDYLRDEFLADQPEEVRTFLLRTSLADTLNIELADLLSGLGNGARILHDLSREHGFVEAADDDTGTYRYHPMLRAVLRAELSRKIPREIPILQHIIGRWHRRNGRPLEALRWAAAAQDKDSINGLLADDDLLLFAANADTEVERLVDGLVADRSSWDPAVITVFAAARLRRGDVDAARTLLGEAESAAAVLPADRARLYRLKHAALRLAVAVQSGPLSRDQQVAAWQAADSAKDRVGGLAEQRAHGWLLATLGMTHLSHAELGPARHALRIASRDFATVGPKAWHKRIDLWLAAAEAADGRLSVARRLIDQVGTDSVVGGLIGAVLALISIEEAEHVRAQEHLASARAWAVEPLLAEPTPEAVFSAVRLRLYSAEADQAGALAALGQLRDSAGTYAQGLEPLIAVMEAGLASPSPIDASLDAIQWADDDSSTAIWPAARSLLRAWRIVATDPAKAVEIVADLIENHDGSRLLDRVSAHLVSAVAHRRLGQKETARQQLEMALTLAAPDEARQVFVDGGHRVRALLTVLLPAESRFASFGAGILHRFERSHGPRPVDAGATSGLTESERAVLRYLPSHLTNEEIAEDLCLSVNTVKTHLRSIYRKLGVGSRRAAIAAAGARGLL